MHGRRMSNMVRNLAWLVVILLMQAMPWGAAGSDLVPSPTSTMWSEVVIPPDWQATSSAQTIWLTGLTTAPDGDPRGLMLLWQKDASGFFPTWKLRLTSNHPDIALGQASKQGTLDLRTTSAPGPGEMYYAAMSVHPGSGSVAIVVENVTRGERLLHQVVENPEFAAPLHRSSPPADSMLTAQVVGTAPVYVPLATTWQLVTEAGGEWSVVKAVDRNAMLGIQMHSAGPVPLGTFRFFLEDEAGPQMLAEVAASGANQIHPIEMPLPVGAVAVSMQYVDAGRIWMSERRSLSVGHVTFELDDVVSDQGILSGTYRVSSDGDLPNAQVHMNVRWDELVWDPKAGRYQEQPHSSHDLAPVQMDLGVEEVAFNFSAHAPVTDRPTTWKAVFSPSIEPNMRTVVNGTEHVIPPSHQAANSLKVMSFNVRFPTLDDGVHAWENRSHLIPEVIMGHAPDVIGFQEPWEHQLSFLDASLPNYEGLTFNTHGLVHLGLYYNTQSVELQESGRFRLSETPDGPGPTPWGGTPRGVIWGRFRVRETGKEFYVFNTHYRSGQEAEDERAFSSTVIRERIQELGENVPVILLGDFNTRPQTKPYSTLVGSPTSHFSDAWESAALRNGPEGTFHGFAGDTGNRRIDWILFAGSVQPLMMQHIHTSNGTTYPSDHLPIQATVYLP